jgi:hypothetical protein
VFRELAASDEARMRMDLARSLSIDPSTASRALGHLQRDGLALRTEDGWQVDPDFEAHLEDLYVPEVGRARRELHKLERERNRYRLAALAGANPDTGEVLHAASSAEVVAFRRFAPSTDCVAELQEAA